MASQRYQIEQTLGEGGFGQVYLARDALAGRLAAVKVLKNSWDSNAAARFKREVEEIGRLTCKRIIRIVDHNLNHDPPFYVMPFFEKGSLRDRLVALQQERKVVSPSYALQALLAVIEGLEVAHRNGIFHRDLKPENILLDDNEELVIADFGIGQFVHRQSMVLTLGGPMGTLDYCTPEQWETGKGSAAADIYSLGIVLFEMLTGCRPRRYRGSLVLPSGHDRRVPPEIDQLFLDMTATVERRIGSCALLRGQVEKILQTRFGVRKPRGLPWGSIALGGGLVALFLWGLFGSGGKR